MKRLTFLLIFIILISGCNNSNKNAIKNIDVVLDNDQYQVYKPFKKGVTNNYMVNNHLNNYYLNDVEDALFTLSQNYFKPVNSWYQAGQYINKNKLKELLSNDFLNKDKEIIIDDITIKPNYVTTIIEQNFLASNGNLKGVTIGLVINPYQTYKGLYGNYNYKQIPEETINEIALQKASDLNSYLNKIVEFKDVKKVVVIYFLNSPNSMLPGTVRYIGQTSNELLKLSKVKYEYQYLKSEYVSKTDINTYNDFINFEQTIKKVSDNINLTAMGLYYNGKLQKIDIDVFSTNYEKNELLYLTELIGEVIATNFNNNTYVKVILKNSTDTVALIIRESNKTVSTITIIGG